MISGQNGVAGILPIQGGRKFYEIPKRNKKHGNSENGLLEQCNESDSADLAKYVNQNIIGSNTSFSTPFGRRRIVYCDHIASGKSLEFIEDFIRCEVLPFYGNTHTTTSVTSLQTTLFRHEARDIFRNATNAAEEDAVIFTGSGTTAAVHKLITALNINETANPVIIFASNQEHHSNLLPWRELSNSKVILIPDKKDGTIDVEYLSQQLTKFSSTNTKVNEMEKSQFIGCFPAASNITGILNDDLLITALLHQHGALAFWDYATAAPHTYIDVNPQVPGDRDGLCKKDALYFSCHKFIGGVQSPGVLIAKKKLFVNPKPDGGGGGSVFFVTGEDHRYLKETEVREEGGTPAIVESIRAGLALQLKQAVGVEYIAKREQFLMNMARNKLSNVSNFYLLGNAFGEGNHHSLPILSFLIKAPSKSSFVKGYLHHNYISALLNDMFGIQSRGGCACAGPYAQSLLGISIDLAKQYESLLMEDERLDRVHLRRGHSEYSQFEILRPGFTRVNLSWFSSDEEVSFVLDALEFIAQHGWKMMPQYIFNNETGEWRHHTNQTFRDRRWLGNISYSGGAFSYISTQDEDISRQSSTQDFSFKAVMENAKLLIEEAPKAAQKLQVPDQRILFDNNAENLRWMILPIEAKEAMISKSTTINLDTKEWPFIPPQKYTNNKMPDIDIDETSKIGSLLSSKNLKVSQKYLQPLYGIDTVAAIKVSMQSNKNLKINTQSNFSKIADKQKLQLPNAEQGSNTNACANGMCVLPENSRSATDVEPAVPKSKCCWHAPPKDIFKSFLEAVEEFSMIKDGDRILVCLSGGKDSLSLLHTMRQYQFYSANQRDNPIKFDLGALTIDPLSSAYDPRPLIPYLKELGVPYLYEEQAIMKQALEAKCSSICAFCSRMKRGRMYAAARREGWTTLALGQHLDDLAESFLMSVFHNGRLRTMKANYTVKEGDLKIIRPFVYTREKRLRNFAETKKLPVIAENCPACFENPKERHRIKQVLAQQELLFPRLYWSLKSAMHPVMNVNRTGVESELFGKTGAIKLPFDHLKDDSSEDDSE